MPFTFVNAFVNDQPPTSRAETEQKCSGLFFVECTEQNGRAPLQTRALRKSHAMRRSITKARCQAPLTEEDDADVTAIHGLDETPGEAPAPRHILVLKSEARSSSKSRSHFRRRYAGTIATRDKDPALHLQGTSLMTCSYSAAVSPFASVKDVPKIWQWFFYGHDVTGKDRFAVARRHFMESTWDKGRDHEMYVHNRACQNRGLLTHEPPQISQQSLSIRAS